MIYIESNNRRDSCSTGLQGLNDCLRQHGLDTITGKIIVKPGISEISTAIKSDTLSVQQIHNLNADFSVLIITLIIIKIYFSAACLFISWLRWLGPNDKFTIANGILVFFFWPIALFLIVVY